MPTYTTHEGLRTVVVDESPSCNMHLRVNLPLMLCPDVWTRYKYSKEDIKTTLAASSTVNVWLCAMVHGVWPTQTSFRTGFDSVDTIVYTCKFAAIRKVLNRVTCRYTRSVLHDNGVDIPPLPLCDVTHREFQAVDAITPSRMPAMTPYNVLRYNTTFHVNNVTMVPLCRDGSMILMNRVIQASVYEQSGRQSVSLCAQPVPVCVNGADMVAVEECCYIRACHSAGSAPGPGTVEQSTGSPDCRTFQMGEAPRIRNT